MSYRTGRQSHHWFLYARTAMTQKRVKGVLWIQDRDHRCTDLCAGCKQWTCLGFSFLATLNCTHRLLHTASDRQRLLLTDQSNDPVRLVHGAKLNTPSWIVIPSGCLNQHVEIIVRVSNGPLTATGLCQVLSLNKVLHNYPQKTYIIWPAVSKCHWSNRNLATSSL